ncbi:MAG: hypothetical protein R3185_07780 [Candidatus Thermoplasmatota archaeon]|nr:hypothetical protein [Candidatus Thermoplasmatota archaeon]
MTTDLPDPPILPQIPGEGVFRVADVLEGLEAREALQDVAGDYPVKDLLAQAHLLCFHGDGYPRVDDHTGHILCPEAYTRTHEPLIVYLDILHELVHVRQVLEGKRVYHFPEPYVTWPTEIEAYRITYDEARRLELPDAWFWNYLAVPWVDDEDLIRLGKTIGMSDPADLASDAKDGVRH